jgi:hypothetical protein
VLVAELVVVGKAVPANPLSQRKGIAVAPWCGAFAHPEAKDALTEKIKAYTLFQLNIDDSEGVGVQRVFINAAVPLVEANGQLRAC